MKIEDVLQCSFTSWYGMFKDVTMESIILPVPQPFLDYLHSDGVVLPESSTHGTNLMASNCAMDGDEDEPDLRDDELMKIYKNDWSLADGGDTISNENPDFGEFDSQVKNAIKHLGGRVFPKLNWSSPKDASWISFDKTLLCTCPCDIYLLLKSSQYIAHDLDMPFSGCTDEAKDKPVITYNLILRRWQPPHPVSEFRCFVRDKNIIGICQRNMDKFYAEIAQDKDNIIEDILQFYSKKIVSFFPLHNYVVDVVRSKKKDLRLIDFNPWGAVTDALMFEWVELYTLSQESNRSQIPEFRCVLCENGIKSSSHAMFGLPQDLLDLTHGEDPSKLVDFVNLKIKKPDNGFHTDSSSDENGL